MGPSNYLHESSHSGLHYILTLGEGFEGHLAHCHHLFRKFLDVLCSRSCPGIWYLSYLGSLVNTSTQLFCVQPFICTTSCFFTLPFPLYFWQHSMKSYFIIFNVSMVCHCVSRVIYLTCPLRRLELRLMAQMVKNLTTVQEAWVWSLVWDNPLEKEMATHSRILGWRKWLPTPGFLVGVFHGQRSLARPWGRKESDMTERLKLWRLF